VWIVFLCVLYVSVEKCMHVSLMFVHALWGRVRVLDVHRHLFRVNTCHDRHVFLEVSTHLYSTDTLSLVHKH
jgi:hypothetical protein